MTIREQKTESQFHAGLRTPRPLKTTKTARTWASQDGATRARRTLRRRLPPQAESRAVLSSLLRGGGGAAVVGPGCGSAAVTGAGRLPGSARYSAVCPRAGGARDSGKRRPRDLARRAGRGVMSDAPLERERVGSMGWRVWVDIGGTFTGVVLADEATDAFAVDKPATTPCAKSRGMRRDRPMRL